MNHFVVPLQCRQIQQLISHSVGGVDGRWGIAQSAEHKVSERNRNQVWIELIPFSHPEKKTDWRPRGKFVAHLPPLPIADSSSKNFIVRTHARGVCFERSLVAPSDAVGTNPAVFVHHDQGRHLGAHHESVELIG